MDRKPFLLAFVLFAKLAAADTCRQHRRRRSRASLDPAGNVLRRRQRTSLCRRTN